MGAMEGGADPSNLANDWIGALDAGDVMATDHELTEDDHEINVLDTDSRLSHSDSEARSHCSSPENVTTPHGSSSTLPFSISNLLGKNFEHKQDNESETLYQNPAGIFQHRSALGLVPTGFYGQGVLRVPAHRPLGGPSSPPGPMFSPWSLGLDPVLQRSAAAAAFATQVVKDRLAGFLGSTEFSSSLGVIL
ncbi:unnamed protein product [Diabrotica balteata]|uniref:Uncharacterized protein n=1 Tax=Diabrotica balteata TaxID=107213 RepID=A0A9N9T2E7_DIABA|nr:unnamed protein product [Diabrotica balteata]